jgi:hypothetical protein
MNRHRVGLLFEHDLCANAFRICGKGKPLRTFPDHALAADSRPGLAAAECAGFDAERISAGDRDVASIHAAVIGIVDLPDHLVTGRRRIC